jgi:hypothetical protein
MFRDDYELPYFDEAGNEFVREISRQDGFIKRGGKLSPPQMIKYENRVAMLVERLVLILEKLQGDTEAVYDYLHSIEENKKRGLLPKQVYQRFMDKIHKTGEDELPGSERDRDRQRVIRGEIREEHSSLSDLPVNELLGLYERQDITRETLFEQLSRRERAGLKLDKMDRDLWGRYRSWVAEKRRIQRSRREDGR